MKHNLWSRCIALSMVGALTFIFLSTTAFTNAPAAHAATRPVTHSSMQVIHHTPFCIPNGDSPNCSQCATGYYNWNYTGAKYKVPIPGGGTWPVIDETNHAHFSYDGRCDIPSISSTSCYYPPRQVVQPNVQDCYIDHPGDGTVRLVQDSAVVYMNITVCVMHIELGSDGYGDYVTYESDNC